MKKLWKAELYRYANKGIQIRIRYRRYIVRVFGLHEAEAAMSAVERCNKKRYQPTTPKEAKGQFAIHFSPPQSESQELLFAI